MRSVETFLLPEGAPSSVEIVHEPGTTALAEYDAGWNIVSLPVDVDRASVTGAIPGAISAAFSFSGSGYVSAESLSIGNGYWVKLASGRTIAFNGPRVARETVAVVRGWNLVGAPASPLGTAGVVTVPAGILESVFTGFSNGTYVTADSLRPGHGCWVKASQAGTILLAPGIAASPAAAVTMRPDALGTLTITDQTGTTRTLRFGEALDPTAQEGPDLPVPAAPGEFDVRFVTGRTTALFPQRGSETHTARIVILSAVYPLRMRWERPALTHGVYLLGGLAGRPSPVVLEGVGEVSIADPSPTTLFLQVVPPPER
jgi:hypothetical protein